VSAVKTYLSELGGGSGNLDDEVTKSVSLGICKVNISSDVNSAFFIECQRFFQENSGQYEPNMIFPSCIQATKKLFIINLIS
jgi:fructose-bisphosphate aldolase class II